MTYVTRVSPLFSHSLDSLFLLKLIICISLLHTILDTTSCHTSLVPRQMDFLLLPSVSAWMMRHSSPTMSNRVLLQNPHFQLRLLAELRSALDCTQVIEFHPVRHRRPETLSHLNGFASEPKPGPSWFPRIHDSTKKYRQGRTSS